MLCSVALMIVHPDVGQLLTAHAQNQSHSSKRNLSIQENTTLINKTVKLLFSTE